MSMQLQALLWGLLTGSALVIGAAVGYFTKLPQRLIAAASERSATGLYRVLQKGRGQLRSSASVGKVLAESPASPSSG